MLARMQFAGVDVRIAAVSAPEATVGEPLTAFATAAIGKLPRSSLGFASVKLPILAPPMLCRAEWKWSSRFLRQCLRRWRRIRPELTLLCSQGLTTPMHLPSHAIESGSRTAPLYMPHLKWLLAVQWAAVRTARCLPAHVPRLRATVPTKDWMTSSSAHGSAQKPTSGTL